ncbi:single-stranded DNA-binding protein [Streptomyces mirabilis]|uniref:single-stranded DNA-binding protein n=1 Tax=Streptomyces mirabilis TaxID=68239 RepID=UPI00099F0116
MPLVRGSCCLRSRKLNPRGKNPPASAGGEVKDCSAWRQLAENLAGSVSKGARVVVAGRLRTDRWETPEGEKRSRMVLDVDDVGASMTFATVTITRTARPVPARETAPDDPWATASPVRPTPPVDGADTPATEAPF